MTRGKFSALFLAGALFTTEAQASVKDTISADLVGEFASVTSTLGLNCASTPQNLVVFNEEVASFVEKLADFVVQQGALLAMKPDYPTMCHVFSKEMAEEYSEGTADRFRLRNKRWRWDTVVDGSIPMPEYIWPKFFIEVSEKGNDSFKAFARGNALYTANRKIAATLAPFIDVNGALSLTAFVTAGRSLLGMLPVPGWNPNEFQMNGPDAGALARNTAITPFENLRIRAAKNPDQPSYEVNIWPVGLSHIAGRLSVCDGISTTEIGYGWPIPGVPNTCPVAMASDAKPYWDTGMLDYLDPQSVAGMGIGSNIATCGAAAAMDALGNMTSVTFPFLGDASSIDGATRDLVPGLKGLRYCSWPILGTAQALASKVSSLASAAKWQGPYCTAWGSVAPRVSTHVQNNDYAFANAALKFKLLAHEIFGVPRPRKERWSLAYPWEGNGFQADEKSAKVLSLLGDISKKLKIPGANVGSRSLSLYFPGDPRLIDASGSLGFMERRAEEIAREGAYLAALGAASVGSLSAANAALDAYNRSRPRGEPPLLGRDAQAASDDAALRAAEDATAHVGQEPIYGDELLCHRSEQKNSAILHGDRNQVEDVGMTSNQKDLPYRGPSFSMAPIAADGACLSNNGFAGCLKWRGGFEQVCKDYNDGIAVLYRKKKVVGWRSTPNPVFKNFVPECKSRGKYRQKNNKEVVKFECTDVESSETRTDTRIYVERPSAENAKTDPLVGAAVRGASAAAPWVAAEIARAKYGNILGTNPLPGNKRIYTIWERVQCKAPFVRVDTRGAGFRLTQYYDVPDPAKRPNFKDLMNAGPSCRTAFRHEIYKAFQKRFLRTFCDGLSEFGIADQKLGAPFR